VNLRPRDASKAAVRRLCLSMLLAVSACAPAVGWRGGRPLDARVYLTDDTTVVTVRRRGTDVSPHLCFRGGPQLQAYLDGRPMERRHRGGTTSDGLTPSGLPDTACLSAHYELRGATPTSFTLELRDGRTVRGRIRVKDGRRRTCGGFGRCDIVLGPRSLLDR
jgi:hypothetical protein